MQTKEGKFSTFRCGYAPVNGLHMYYEIHGNGKPLVLIHGGGSTIGTSFGRILPLLANEHLVVAVELQAHGRTADIDRPLSFEQDADDVAALLKHLNVRRADILGFSNGGTTALQLAIRHPQVVGKLVAASAIFKKEGAYPFLWDFLGQASIGDMPDALKEAYLSINPSQEDLMRMHDRDLLRMQSFVDVPEAAIRTIRAETLVLIGDRDVVTPEHSIEMARLIPNARLMILPGGHGEYLGEITTLQAGKTPHLITVTLIKDFLKADSRTI